MQENSLSPFHGELLGFLKRDVKKRCAEEGFDPDSDAQLQALMKGLSSTATDGMLPLAEIIDNYQHLFGCRGPIHIEKILLDAFPIQDFIELGLARYYPRIYRGLPRLYHRSSPAQSHIKKNFTHLPSLKKQALSRALFSLYANYPARGKVAILSYVMNDGFGDYVAAADTLRILKTRFPDLELSLVAIVPARWASRLKADILIPYEQEAPPLPSQAVAHLEAVDLVLQIPTFCPRTADLKLKRMERVGEYGFAESSWFHPRSGGYSMGLHFLEKGILIRKLKKAGWEDVKNASFMRWRCPDNHFYLAYLYSPIGGAIYLHALLKSLENDPRDIDLCVPDLGWFIQYVERQKRAERNILEWDMGVGSIEVIFQEHIYAIPLASPSGKKVRLICPGQLDSSDFQILLHLSGNFVAVRGNQSLTEVISTGKPFFYDGREHARYFIKDLSALAENRIGGYKSALECIRGMHDAFLYHAPIQEEEWVDETFFQELDDWTAIALKMGMALQESDILLGFQKLSQIIASEYSANHFLCHLVQRALCHADHPDLEQFESREVSRFTAKLQTFRELIRSLSKKIAEIGK